MKAILIVIGGLVLANITWATFFWQPRPPQPASVTTVNAATKLGQDPWMVKEKKNDVESRDRSRQGIMKTLDLPRAELCTSKGRKRLIQAVNHYYSGREHQAALYGRLYGEEARRYAQRQWQTPTDHRIQRLIGEAYGRGHFSLDELRSEARKVVADSTKGIKVDPNPCAD